MVLEVFSVFERIKEVASRKEKEGIIALFYDNTKIMHTLNFLLNDYITTGVDKKKLEKPVKAEPVKDIANIIEMIDWLKENNTGSDGAVATIQNFIKKSELLGDSASIGNFLSELLTKRYKLGVTAKTVNKALGKNFIPTFDVQLAERYDKNTDFLEGKEFAITEKLDGNRLIAIIKSDGVKFFSRQGKEIEGLVDIEQDILSMEFTQDFIQRLKDGIIKDGLVFDGELLATGVEPQEVYSATTKIVRKLGEKHGLTYHIFDAVGLKHFEHGVGESGYKTRYGMLKRILEREDNLNHVKIVPHLYIGTDKSVIPRLLKEVENRGKEGLMINIYDGEYVCGRTKNLLKVKSFYTSDLEIVGYFEGDGKYQGMLGGVIVDYRGTKVRVGSGFTQQERRYLWFGRDELKGKIAEIQFFSESKNQNNDDVSLRFPVWVGLREDKSLKDVNIEG